MHCWASFCHSWDLQLHKKRQMSRAPWLTILDLAQLSAFSFKQFWICLVNTSDSPETGEMSETKKRYMLWVAFMLIFLVSKETHEQVSPTSAQPCQTCSVPWSFLLVTGDALQVLSALQWFMLPFTSARRSKRQKREGEKWGCCYWAGGGDFGEGIQLKV